MDLKLIILCALTGLLQAATPPHIAVPSNDHIEDVVGETVWLPCTTDADSESMLQWTKDGESIHRGWERFKMKPDGMRIKDVMLEDTGIYVCRAINGFGFDEITFMLGIKSNDSMTLPPDFIDRAYPNTDGLGELPVFTYPKRMEPTVLHPAGNTARLICTATGQPRPQITWYKDGSLLRRGSWGDEGEDEDARWTLKLRDLRETDTGEYTCKVSNSMGTIKFTYMLEVVDRLEKPVIGEPHPLNTTAYYGEIASFQCRVHSEVKPTIQWLKRVDSYQDIHYKNRTIDVEGQPFVVLQTGEVMQRDDGVYVNKLTIQRATMEDAGRYICLGVNSMGTTFKDAYLTVIPPSHTVDGGQQDDISANSSASLFLIIIVPSIVIVVVVTIAIYCLWKKSRPFSRPKGGSSGNHHSVGNNRHSLQQQQQSLHQQAPHHPHHHHGNGLVTKDTQQYDHHYSAIPVHHSTPPHLMVQQPGNMMYQSSGVPPPPPPPPHPIHHHYSGGSGGSGSGGGGGGGGGLYPPLLNGGGGGLAQYEVILKNYGDLQSDVCSSVPQMPTPHNSNSSAASSYSMTSPQPPHNTGMHTHMHYART